MNWPSNLYDTGIFVIDRAKLILHTLADALHFAMLWLRLKTSTAGKVLLLFIAVTWTLFLGAAPLEDITDKLYAVHATSVLPKDGKLIASLQYRDADLSRTLGVPPSLRPTIHFSLGELVRNHSRYSWEHKRYAVILPLRHLQKQLVNINPFDTFIMGDYQISPGGIVVVPKSHKSRVPWGIKKVTYGRGETLRQAVARVISQEGGLKVTMVEQTGNGWRADLSGVDINRREFFEDFLAQNPQVSFGSHTYSEVGEAFRLGVVDITLRNLFLLFAPDVMSDLRVKFAETIVRRNLAKIALQAKTFSPEMKSTFLRHQDIALGWLNILSVDKELRTQYGSNALGHGSNAL